MGKNPLPNHFQWSGKVLPAGEGGLQLEVSVCLPGLEQLQPFTFLGSCCLSSWKQNGFCVYIHVMYTRQHICVWKWFKSICRCLHVDMLFWPEISASRKILWQQKAFQVFLLEEIDALLVYLRKKFILLATLTSEGF